jgi:primary-amine oxidase
MIEEFFLVPEIVRADPGWREAMTKRGITRFEDVQIDPWSAGHFGFPDEKGVRLVRANSYLRGDVRNPYPRPIEGVIAYVDLSAKKVFKLIDMGVVPVPEATFEYDQESVGKIRTDLKPLQTNQPEGPSFTVIGNEVRWQNWRFRFQLHPREGLVLHQVGYEDRGKLRSVLYRAGLSEMIVPYADPGEAWFFRNPFDSGEYGLGYFANPLEPGGDAPENAVYFNAVLADNDGVPFEIPRAVAIYERDGGVMWRHFDVDTRDNSTHTESRRARELVISIFATVGNYDYGFNWVFHQDGQLEIEILLTGILVPQAVKPEGTSGPGNGNHPHGTLIAENVVAVHHQHFFNFRLDLDVDGPEGNSVLEMNVEPLPEGEDNPHSGGFVMRETPLRNEKDGKREMNLLTQRKWRVVNPSVKNSLGQNVGYVLIPGKNSISYAAPNSSVRKRAGFLDAPLWVTPYDPSETNAAGRYVNQSQGGDGLPKWTAANHPIENKDIVLWYTVGVTHVPRPEEWPVMPVEYATFSLVPFGFFSQNPALDLPKPDTEP